ncbi:MAG: hypothetical protein WCO52_00910 [bacterium]
MAQIKSFSVPRSLAIIGIGLAIGVVILWQVAIPFREKVAARYVERGDAYLVVQEFDSAAGEYQKGLDFDRHNAQAAEGLRLAKLGPVDVAQLREFYISHNATTVISQLDNATKSYPNPKSALQAGVDLYAKHQYNYARYPMQSAVKLDPGYPEAWNYLGLDYQKLAEWDASYTTKAEEMFKKRDALTPNYLVPAASPSPTP